MFQEGDRVVHPNHGAGVIKGLEASGEGDGEVHYYVIELYANRLTVMVPVANADTIGIRHVDEALVDKALAELCDEPSELPNEFKSRQKELMEKLRSGDTRLVAQVCRDLAHRGRAGQLTSTDSRVFDQARDFVATELAAVRGCDPSAAFAELAELLDGAEGNQAPA